MNLTADQKPKNPIIKSVLEMVPGNGPVTPEHIIFGFAKLFLMDEVQIDIIIPSVSIDEIYKIKERFNSYNFNCELIKNTFTFYIQNGSLFGNLNKLWSLFVQRGVAIQIKAMDLFQEALDCTFVNMSDFKNGSGLTMIDIFAKQQAMLSKSNPDSKGKSPKDAKVDIDWDELFSDPKHESKDQKKVIDEEEEEEDEIEELLKFLRTLDAEESGKKTEEEEENDESSEQESKEENANEKDVKDTSLRQISKHFQDITLKIFENIRGQDSAVMKFVRGIYRGQMQKDTGKNKGPLAHFFFVGPSGTGKTFLATCGAEALGYDKNEILFLNMSEYSSHNDVLNLVGTAPGYNSGDQSMNEGTLTKFLAEHLCNAKEVGKNHDRKPIYEYSKKEDGRCIVVLDEIEKASIEVLKTLLPVIGQGICHDMFRQYDIDCSNAIFIFTSNLGKDLYDSTTAPLTTLPDKVVANAIGSEIDPRTGEPYLPAELVSRLASGNMIMFNHLSISTLVKIARESMEKMSVQLCKNTHCKIKIAEDLPSFFLFTRGSNIDARVASSSSASFVSDEVYEFIRQVGQEGINGNINTIEFNIDIDSLAGDMKQLFVRQGKSQILIVANEDMKKKLSPKDEQIEVHFASNYEDAIKQFESLDEPVVFIDPETGYVENDEDPLSVTDYSSDGVKVFRKLTESNDAGSIFVLNKDEFLSATDAETFVQIGASAVINFATGKEVSLRHRIISIVNEDYLEKSSKDFCGKGYVIGYGTKQTIDEKNAIGHISFYDLKKTMAFDIEAQGTVLSDVERPTTKFKDVIGAGQAKEELKFFIEYLKNPKEFAKKGVKPAKGILMYGPPGTGKTMLARAMAGESNVTFIQKAASDFRKDIVGAGEKEIRRVFNIAKKYAPTILFIDEIDTIGKARGGENNHEATLLNTLLTEIDGFKTSINKPVFVLCATNFGVGDQYQGVGELDPALVRRFDNKILIDLPSKEERKDYIDLYLNREHIEGIGEDTKKNIADRTPGLSIALLQNILSLAVRNALKNGKKPTDDDLLNALEEYLYGEKRESSVEYYKSVAIHETGHAIVSYLSGEKPSYITIESRGDFGGYMMPGDSEKHNYNKEDILALIRTSLAGRAAESVFYGEEAANNTGASSDLKRATDLAFRTILSYGMESNSLLVMDVNAVLQTPLAAKYADRANEILIEEYAKTIDIIKANKDKIQAIADALVSKSHLTGEEFAKLMEEK